jgi:hypothetical protein
MAVFSRLWLRHTHGSALAGPAPVTLSGPAIGVLVVISLIMAEFRAGKRSMWGAYSDNGNNRQMRLRR